MISMTISDFFVIIGVAFLAKYLCHWGKTLFALFLARPFGLTIDFRKFGDWAVVTGSSDGIGKAFAFELASKGLNIVLLGRNQQKIQQCGEEIESQFKVKTRTIQVDFAKEDHYYQRIQEEVADLQVAILVNNVGMCQDIPDYFHAVSEGDNILVDMIRCNVLAATNMTRICLPGMVKRKAGVVVNVASASALLPTPLVAIYSASKAYVDFFSRALQLELQGSGVIIQSLLPFTVRTKMTGNPPIGFFVADAQNFVRSSLDTVGILHRSHGCLAHSLQGWWYSILPLWLSSRLQWQFFSQLRLSLLAQNKEQN